MRRLIAKLTEQDFTPARFLITVILPAAIAVVLGTALILATAPKGA